MNITDMKALYTELIRSVSKGYRDRYITNPAVIFTKNVKEGRYDNVSDAEYYRMLNQIKEIGNTWLGKSSETVKQLLITAIENIDMTDESAEIIGKALYEAYLNTDQSRIPCDWPRSMSSGKSTGESTKEKNSGFEFWEDGLPFEEEYEAILKTPAGIYNYLNDSVYGQDEAKKAAAMLLWNHVHGRRQNIVFAGPTGSGKTEIFRQLSKIYPNIVIHNATSITGTGWKGNMKVENLFDGVPDEMKGHLIIVLDEADKMFEDADERHYSYIIQNELLKLMEGDMAHFKGEGGKTTDIDTSGVSFVFLGSFDTMVKEKSEAVNKNRVIGFTASGSDEEFCGYGSIFTQEDLTTYANVRTEIAGRINNIVQLQEMSGDDFYAILCSKNMSPIESISKDYGVKVRLSTEAKRKLAQEAAEKKMGVRYMRSQIQRRLDEKLFANCSKKEYRL